MGQLKTYLLKCLADHLVDDTIDLIYNFMKSTKLIVIPFNSNGENGKFYMFEDNANGWSIIDCPHLNHVDIHTSLMVEDNIYFWSGRQWSGYHNLFTGEFQSMTSTFRFSNPKAIYWNQKICISTHNHSKTILYQPSENLSQLLLFKTEFPGGGSIHHLLNINNDMFYATDGFRNLWKLMLSDGYRHDWTPCDLPNVSFSFSHYGIGNIGHFIYICGGGYNFLSCFRYDNLGQWYRLSDMPFPIDRCDAIGLDGYLFVLGEYYYKRCDMLKYDPKINIWSILPKLPYAGQKFVLVGGKI